MGILGFALPGRSQNQKQAQESYRDYSYFINCGTKIALIIGANTGYTQDRWSHHGQDSMAMDDFGQNQYCCLGRGSVQTLSGA